MAILWPIAAALGSFLVGNTRAAQAHTSLDKASNSQKGMVNVPSGSMKVKGVLNDFRTNHSASRVAVR